MNFKNKALLLTLALAMAAQGDPSIYAPEKLPDNSKPYPKNKSLPAWDVGGHIIYAKNEKDALKYAKKRGLFKEGMRAIPAEKTDPF